LWRGEPAAARKLLARAARGHRRPAVPLAYESLSRRMRSDFKGALAAADEAAALDPECLEARAARAAALLSLKRLVDACLAYHETSRLSAHDRDGHALRLLTVALFAETIANSREDDEGLLLNFAVTPATRCAIRTLDGRPALGVEEAAAAGGTVVDLAVGAALYFLGRGDEARAEWTRAKEAFPDSGRNAPIRLSLKVLLAEPSSRSRG
jgi:tetratricopeptide (TPR) repeat protein